MRMSKTFGQTLREAPADAEVASHQLLLRAGFIRPVAAGIFSSLPLAQRALSKIESILRQEMNRIGGQEISMPVVQPGELWKESGRWDKIDAELGRFKDRAGREMALAMTHEEVVADLARREIHSYRQLPQLIYQVHTKFRDDPRPRAGLIRVREFTMKDSYSLDADWEGLDRQYQAHYEAYFNIFQRCGLPVMAVKADTGIMGGVEAHEFMYLTPVGEDTLLLCDACGYSANRQVARMRKPAAVAEEPLALEPVATPECKTIEQLAAFLNVPPSRTAKAVFMMAAVDKVGEENAAGEHERQSSADPSYERFVFAIVRGDMEVNETKLAHAIEARSLRPATEDEIRRVGAEPGYASPVDLEQGRGDREALVVVDELICESANLVAGANRPGYHLRNVNYGRDYRAHVIADITAVQPGDACPDCGQSMRSVRGVEVGNIFKLGTHFSEAMGATILDAEGKERPVVMGSYGIGVGRLLACIAEQHHDERGLSWPVSVAPYAVHLLLLAGKGQQADVTAAAERLYAQLGEAGVEVLYDDRDESPGVKFNDADLIGLPIRLTVSGRALQAGGVELKHRRQEERSIVPLEEITGRVLDEIAALHTEIQSQISAPPPFH